VCVCVVGNTYFVRNREELRNVYLVQQNKKSKKKEQTDRQTENERERGKNKSC